MTAAKFITLEGGEGAGKSTQGKILSERLRAVDIQSLVTREPGGSPFAEQLRHILLSPDFATHDPLAQTLLFYAARADHLAKTIWPALQRGEWVICDRFSDSTYVYQSYAGGLAQTIAKRLENIVVGTKGPNLTIILDLPAELGLKRATARHHEAHQASPRQPEGRDIFEARDLAFHEKLREGFLAIAQAEPRRCAVIDATQSVDDVAQAIWAVVADRLQPGAT